MAVAWVQNQVDSLQLCDGVTTSFTFTLLHTVTKGNTLIGYAIVQTTTYVTNSYTDNNGNTYTSVAHVLNNGVSQYLETFAFTNVINVPTTITINLSSAPPNGTTVYFVLDELSGASAINGNAILSNSPATTTPTSGTIPITGSNAAIWACYVFETTGSVLSAGSGFTLKLNDTTNNLYTEFKYPVSANQAATFSLVSADDGMCGAVAFSPTISFVDTALNSFPVRFKQDYQMLAASSKQDQQWPFTATVTPGQLGWEWRPEFARSRWQRMRYEDYTFKPPAVTAPTWGLDDTILPVRRRFQPLLSTDEHWPFTVALTPGQFGWDNPERFPLRIRPRPLTVQDEEWPFTATSTPAQFGWDNPEHFPLRVRFQPSRSEDVQFPFTAAVTPTQFGWQIDPSFPQRLRFRPLVPAEQLLRPIAGTPTPTNIDFAYPPEFYTERKKYQPLIYEFWQPDIPPVSPTQQVMVGLAIKTKAKTGATYITVTLQGTGIFMFAQQPAPTIFNEVLPFGSAHVVLTSGSMPVSVALGVSNDGVNFVQLGPALTQFPNVLNLTASPTLNMNNLAPFKYHAWIVTGGDITTLLTITEILVGWRA